MSRGFHYITKESGLSFLRISHNYIAYYISLSHLLLLTTILDLRSLSKEGLHT